MLGLSSSGVTVMLSLTRVALIFSTVVVTMGVSVVRFCSWEVEVGATGFEPAASRSQSGRSTKLSYAPDAARGPKNGLPKSNRLAARLAARLRIGSFSRVPPEQCHPLVAHFSHGRYRDHGAPCL